MVAGVPDHEVGSAPNHVAGGDDYVYQHGDRVGFAVGLDRAHDLGCQAVLRTSLLAKSGPGLGSDCSSDTFNEV